MNIKGYELHCGITNIDTSKDFAFSKINNIRGTDILDGSVNLEQNVLGTYLHGIFDNEEFTQKIINNIKKLKGIDEEDQVFDYKTFKDNEYFKLEKHFRENLDLKKIYSIMY